MISEDVVRCQLPSAFPGYGLNSRAPVLMIVGEADHEMLDVNRHAIQFLPRRAKLIRIPGTVIRLPSPARWLLSPSTMRWLDGLTMNSARGLLGLRGSAS